MAPQHTLFGLALAISSVLGAPVNEQPAAIQSRSVIDHDAVVGFAETVPDTEE